MTIVNPITVGELIEKLQEYEPTDFVRVAGEYEDVEYDSNIEGYSTTIECSPNNDISYVSKYYPGSNVVVLKGRLV